MGGLEGALRLAEAPPPFVGLLVPIVVPGFRLDGTDRGVEFDPDLVYRLRPGERLAGRFPIGPNGFALPALRNSPGSEGLRVACLGDSCTFGIGAGPKGSFAWRLATSLARAFPAGAADVLNAGRPGYSSAQSLALLRRDVLPLRPAVVVAYLGANNDFVRVSRLSDHDVLERLRGPAVRLAAASNLARLFVDRLAPSRGEWSPSPDHVERVPLPLFERDLEEVARLARNAGAEPVFLVPPFSPEKRAAFPVCLEYAEAVRRVARRLDAASLDATEAFGILEPYPLFAEPIHPNAEGHRLLASRLYDLLVTDARLARAFDRAGPGGPGLRDLERLAARAEREPVADAEWEAVRGLLAPDRSDPLLQAMEHLARGDLEEAAERLEAAARAHPYRPGVRRLAARVHALRGDAERQRAALAQLEAIRTHVVDTDPLEVALREGTTGESAAALATPALARAAAILVHRDRVLGEGSRFDRRVSRAVSPEWGGTLEERAALLEGVLETNPAEPVALRLLAEHALRRDRDDLAEAFLLRLLEARPEDWAARLRLARLLAARGESARALEATEVILADFPGAGDAWALRIELLETLGDVEGARRAAAEGSRAAPAHAAVAEKRRRLEGSRRRMPLRGRRPGVVMGARPGSRGRPRLSSPLPLRRP